MGHRPGVKGGYFPVQPVDSHERPARRDDVGLHRHGPDHGDPSPRGGAGAERARLPLRHPGEDRRQRAEVQVHPAQRRPQLRQVGDLHAEAALWRQRLGHAHPPVDLEGQQAAVRGLGLCRPVGDGAVLHRRHHQARQGAQRLLQRQHQLLQARHPGLRGAGAAGLLLAQPLGLVPHPLLGLAEGQARRSPLPRSVGQSLPRLRGDADGRHRRHPEQDPSGRPDGQEPVRPAAGGADQGSDRRGLAARGAELRSTPTAPS